MELLVWLRQAICNRTGISKSALTDERDSKQDLMTGQGSIIKNRLARCAWNELRDISEIFRCASEEDQGLKT